MSQPILHSPSDFTTNTSLKTGRTCTNTSLSMQIKKKVSKKKCLALYEDYLKKRVKESWPNCRMGSRLFKEIKAKGYRGSLRTLGKFLRKVQEEGEFPKERSLSYYERYLKKRLEEVQPNRISARKLFAEITAKGYRGSLSALEKFLWILRKETKPPKEAFIQFHKEYLIKRIKGALPDFASGTQLLEEIQARGYRGSANTFQTFLSALRKKEKRPSEVSLDFHKGYIIERIKGASPDFVSGTQLFKEIRAKGYRGSLTTLQGFLSVLRKQEKTPSEDLSNAYLEFHRDYLTKRLEETYPKYALGTELFKEIKAKGYEGSLSMLRLFLSVLRKQEKTPNEACVEFHEEYLSKRLEETYPSFAPATQLFKEIRAKGYQGSLGILQGFLPTLRKQTERPSEACVRFHKEYLSKRIQDALPDFVPAQKLFEEITDRGYRGAFSTLQVFLSALRKQEEGLGKELGVHRNYSIKRLDKPHPDRTKQLLEENTEKRILSPPGLDKNDLPEQLDKAPLVHKNVLSKASLQFHKDYLIKILQETWPSRLSPKQLFEKIVSRGYRGTCKEVEVFLMMISK